MKAENVMTQLESGENSERMPVLFIGHGHPINAISDNNFTRHLSALGATLPTPKAILMISAHWLTRGTFVSVSPSPETIYDFGRFDDRLFDIKYNADGNPSLAKETIRETDKSGYKLHEDNRMGLDHGAWTVLKHIFPLANVPVFQLSIDVSKPTEWHFDLGQKLKKLREKGVMIIGSGNIVHNLYDVDWNNMEAKILDYAIEFDAFVKKNLDSRNFAELVNYRKIGTLAQKAQPTNEHYLPLLYSIAATHENEPMNYSFEGFQYAGISMRCVRFS